MGGCLSSPAIRRSNSPNLQTPMANVISSTGQLLRHKIPITVAQALRDRDGEQSDSFVLCNSDRLIEGEHIKPMSMKEELQSGQIYFQLPSSRLRYPLTGSDMAALAVKVTNVLQIIPSTANPDFRKIQNNRICPVVVLEELKIDCAADHHQLGNLQSSSSSSPLMKSDSVKKSQGFAYRGGPMMMAPFKMSLSTIYEDSVLL